MCVFARIVWVLVTASETAYVNGVREFESSEGGGGEVVSGEEMRGTESGWKCARTRAEKRSPTPEK